jgi:hypothetical protein
MCQIGNRTEPETLLVQPAEAPHCHAAKGEILVRITQMRELPIEYAAEVALIDHQIAYAQIAVEHAKRRRRRGVGPQPRQAERDGGPVAACLGELRGQCLDPGCRFKDRQKRQVCGIKRVNPRHGSRNLPEQRGGRGQGIFRIGRAGHAAHDETKSEFVLRREFGHDHGGDHPAGMRTADHSRFLCHIELAARDPFSRRRAA